MYSFKKYQNTLLKSVFTKHAGKYKRRSLSMDRSDIFKKQIANNAYASFMLIYADLTLLPIQVYLTENAL